MPQFFFVLAIFKHPVEKRSFGHGDMCTGEKISTTSRMGHD
jgi:hypothetical protein